MSGNPVCTVFELEGCHDFSGGVLADLNQSGWSRTAAVSEFEPDPTGTEADDDAFDKNGQVDAQEIPPYEMAPILLPSVTSKMTGNSRQVTH